VRADPPSTRPPLGARIARWTCAASFAALGAVLGGFVGCFATALAILALDVYPDDVPYQAVGAMFASGGLGALAAALVGIRLAQTWLPRPRGRAQ
jgi:hypothetical protein